MKKTSYFSMYVAVLVCIFGHIVTHAKQESGHTLSDNNTLAEQFNKQANDQEVVSTNKELVDFTYHETPLTDILTELAEKKGVNVILPVGANTIEQKVSLQLDRRITLEAAWEILIELLEMSGYAIVKHDQAYMVTKLSPQISSEPLPLYVGTKPKDLPDSDMRIRYIYYLANLKIGADNQSEVTEVISALLPDDAKVLANQAANCIILVDTARNIKSVMEVVTSLDKTDFQETIEYLPLRYVPAKTVAELFGELLKTNKQTSRYRLDARASGPTFFSEYIRIIPEERTNSLILLGRSQAVSRVRDFIENYIDVELDSGRSILHTYKLQYLDAQSFAQVLQRIVTSTNIGGSGQSAAGSALSGTERFFQDVIIRADSSGATPTEGQYQYYGGNKLVVAANNEDWIRIRKLIEQLDTPQPQVIIEVLIADLDINDLRLLGSTVRNPCELPFPNLLDAQSAQTTGIVVQPLATEGIPQTIQADLLAFSDTTGTTPALSNTLPGTTVIAFNDRNDGRTWSITQIRQAFEDRKIIDNPHVMATNNQKAIITLGESRLLPDQSTAAEGGTTQINRRWIPANLILEITPRISSANTVNLTVNINIDRYENPATSSIGDPLAQAQNNIANRQVVTNANVHDQDVLALGGLTRVENTATLRRVPILGRIPIIGYWFKHRENDARKTNLTVFISPTIVSPRLRAGTSEYTEAYIAESKDQIKQGLLFDSLRDPITRFFFNPTDTDDQIETLDRFVAKDEFKARELAFGDIKEKEFSSSMRHVVMIREERGFENPLPPGFNELSEPTPISGTENNNDNNIISVETEFPDPPTTETCIICKPRIPNAKRSGGRKHGRCSCVSVAISSSKEDKKETHEAKVDSAVSSSVEETADSATNQPVEKIAADLTHKIEREAALTTEQIIVNAEQETDEALFVIAENQEEPDQKSIEKMIETPENKISASQILADDRLKRMQELLADMDSNFFEA